MEALTPIEQIRFEPARYFRLEEENGRWWFVTPEGQPFLSFGVNHVTWHGNRARGTDRNPYEEAVLAKYGTPEKWAEAVCDRLKGWGFNTIGAWSVAEVNPYLPRTPILRAEKVWILSGETSQAGARKLHSGLSIVRPGVRFVDERTFGADACDAGPSDAAVVIDFFRYRRRVTQAAQLLARSGVVIVAITDSPLSPLVELTDTWCEIEVPAIGPFDSSVPAVAIAELLVSRVARDLQDEATARIDRIEALWQETGVFQQ